MEAVGDDSKGEVGSYHSSIFSTMFGFLVEGPFWQKCFPYPICKQIFVTILFDDVEDVLRKVDELRLDGISPITEATKRNNYLSCRASYFVSSD